MTTSAYGGKNFKFGSTGVGEKPFDLGKEIQQTLGVFSSEDTREDQQSPANALKLAENSSASPFNNTCLLYTSPSPRDATLSRMPSSA